MSPLEQSLADYLRIRRALGYKLERGEKLLSQYLAHLEALGQDRVTIENALGWARMPAAGSGSWWAFRLSVVRGFATYLHALDPAHEVPPADVLPHRPRRAIPYLYSDREITALIAATDRLRGELRQATYRTVIGLLAVTGMRVGEAIRLDRQDLDLGRRVLTVRESKFGKSRELPLHSSTVKALRGYLRVREAHHHADVSDALLISPAGTRLIYCNVHATFRQLRRDAGLKPRSTGCRPRIHDLRHRFAVRTLLSGIGPASRCNLDSRCSPPISGTSTPRTPTGILSAAPELLRIASQRLEDAQERRS